METPDEMQAKWQKAIEEAGAATEQEMREADVPWPETTDELVEYINTLTDRPHDYGTCVYAMSMAAVAAYQHVARKLGVTGFQASCADLDVIRRTRGLKGPFALIKGQDMLYPQYDILGTVQEHLKEWQSWASEEAQKMIDEQGGEPKLMEWEDDNGQKHSTTSPAPRVWEHWQRVAGLHPNGSAEPA